MPKLSLELGLAIGGIILTLLLVILDKADKLKGSALFWLLALAAVLTLPLLLGNDFIDGASVMWRWWLRGLMVAIVALGYGAIAIWISPSSVPEPKRSDKSSGPSDYSNAQIKDSALALARRLRQFQEQITAETMTLAVQQMKANRDKNPMSQEELVMRMTKLGSEQESRWGPLRAETNTMIFHLQNRVPAPQPIPNERVMFYLSGAPLAGVHPIGAVADYVDQLAQLVPVDRPSPPSPSLRDNQAIPTVADPHVVAKPKAKLPPEPPVSASSPDDGAFQFTIEKVEPLAVVPLFHPTPQYRIVITAKDNGRNDTKYLRVTFGNDAPSNIEIDPLTTLTTGIIPGATSFLQTDGKHVDVMVPNSFSYNPTVTLVLRSDSEIKVIGVRKLEVH